MKKFIISLVVALIVVLPVMAEGEKESETVQQTAPVVTPIISTELSTKSTPLYRVELYDTKTITQQDVDEAVSYYSSQLGYQVPEEEVVKDLIDNTLLSQAIEKALKDKTIDVYDGQFNDYVSYQLQLLASKYGFELKSEEDAENFLKQFNTSYEEFANSCLLQWSQEQYIEKFGKGKLSSVEEPTEEEIKSFLDSNRNLFVGDEYVKVAHIFFATAKAKDDKEKATIKQKADSVYKKVKSGSLTYEKACKDYSEDKISSESGGVLEYWIGRGDSDMVTAFGENALKSMFSLGIGEISEVQEGPQGFHIFKCLSHKDATLLNLDDMFNPNGEYTVKDVIVQQLKAEKYQETYMKVYEELIESLRNQAKIKSLKSN